MSHCSHSQIAIIDCPIRFDFLATLKQSRVFSTNPLSTLELTAQQIDHIRVEEQGTVADLISIHGLMARIDKRLQAEYNASSLSKRYPDPFRVHAHSIRILLFSFLSKIKEIEYVFAAHAEEKREGAIKFYTTSPNAHLPSYPLQENDSIYAWIIDRLASRYNIQLD